MLGFRVPPRKRKRTRMEQTSAIITTAMAKLEEMDRAAAARVDARLELFMEHERKLWESQERLLREDWENRRMLFEMLLSRLPGLAPQTQQPQQPMHQYGLGNYDNSFCQGGPAYSSTPTKHGEKSTYRHLWCSSHLFKCAVLLMCNTKSALYIFLATYFFIFKFSFYNCCVTFCKTWVHVTVK